MRLALYIIGGGLIVLGLAYHFAALALFNALVPKDRGGALAASGVAYGAHPRQRFDIYRPDGPGPFPVLVFAYGGAWDSGRRHDYAFAGRAFAAQGFLTVIPDYRLAPEAHYPDFVHDIADAAAAALKEAPRHGGDPTKLCFSGHSAGGYNVTQAALLPGLLESRGIDRHTLKAVATIAAPADFKPLDFPSTRAAFGRYPDLDETQPMRHASKDAPPFLMLHGRHDTTVGLHNSVNLAAALKEAGAEAEVKVYDNLTHVDILLALSQPLRGRAPVLSDAAGFLQRYC
jgi:acetyl esterase/lipase